MTIGVRQVSIALFLIWALFAGSAQAQNQEGWPCRFACVWVPSIQDMHFEFGQTVQDHLPSRQLNILVWNLYKGNKPEFGTEFQRLAERSDIVMAAEALTGPPVRKVLESKARFGWNFAIGFFMRNWIATGVTTGSFARPDMVGFERTSDVEPLVSSPKTLLVTRFLVRSPGGRVLGKMLLLNIHGINFTGTAAFVRHLDLARKYIEEHTGPVLFAGDFNTRNSERYEKLMEFASEYGMRRAPWTNVEGRPLDDAILRGFTVEEATYIHEVKGKGSDHPALHLRVRPEFL